MALPPLNRLLVYVSGLLLTVLTARAQEKHPILLKSGKVFPTIAVTDVYASNPLFASAVYNNKIYLLAQFAHIPTQQEQDNMQHEGLHLLEYVPQHTYLVAIEKYLPAATLKKFGITGLYILKPADKIDPVLVQTANTEVTIAPFKDISRSTFNESLKKMSLPVTVEGTGMSSRTTTSVVNLPALGTQPFVHYIEAAPAAPHILNNESGMIHLTRVLQSDYPGPGRNLSGKGVVIGIGDNGGIFNHIDLFYKSTDNLLPQPHASHVSGTAAGMGLLDPTLKGHAPGAQVMSFGFSQVLDPSYYNQYGIVVTNNSYGTSTGCANYGRYTSLSASIDDQMLQIPQVLHVFAAGNDGISTCPPAPMGYHTVYGDYQSAKNVLTVAGTGKDSLYNYFSRGPVVDGRIKPEIVSVGGGVVSCVPGNLYAKAQGTSMAAPQVTGTLALLYERYRQLNNNRDPQAALMKAIVCNSATDVGRKGPDFENGFGILNALTAVETIEKKNYFTDSLQNNQQKTFTINVPPGLFELKTMLYWADKPGSPLTPVNLVNDLDITITAPNGTVYKPYVLDTSIAGLFTPAVTGEDHINNIEQVVIQNPAAGNYTVTVKGYNVPFGPQSFFVVYNQQQKGLRLLYPVGHEKWKWNILSLMRWEQPEAPPGTTFDLEMSYDGGVTWRSVWDEYEKQSIFFGAPFAISGNTVVRVTNHQTKEQVVSEPFAIMPEITPILSSPCEGFIKASWAPVSGIDSVVALVLKDGNMQRAAASTGDHVILSGMSRDSIFWLALQPYKNGVPGERSIAASIIANGKGCSLPQNNGNIKLESIVSPRSGRKSTSTERGNAEPIRVLIKNLDDDPSSTPVILKAYVNNVLYSTDTLHTPVAANDSLLFTLSRSIDLVTPGKYNIAVTATKQDDPDTLNNTVTALVKIVPNNPISLPWQDDFLPMKDTMYLNRDYTGLEGAETYDFSPSNLAGALAVTNYNNTKAIVPLKIRTLRFDTTYNTVITTYNLSSYTLNDNIRYSSTLTFVSVRGSDTSAWIPSPSYEATNVNITRLLAVNGQKFSSSFQIRFYFENLFSELTTLPLTGISLNIADNDIRLMSAQLAAASYLTSDTVVLNARVANTMNRQVDNIKVMVQLPGNKIVIDSIASINAYDTIIVPIKILPNNLSRGTTSLKVWVSNAMDSYRGNDTLLTSVTLGATIKKFPYYESFEQSAGDWVGSFLYTLQSNGVNRKVRKAANGSRFWYTGEKQPTLPDIVSLNGFVNLSPTYFDLRGLKNPVVSVSFAGYLRKGMDSAFMEYFIFKTAAVKRLLNTGGAVNWYDSPGKTNWSDSLKPYWHVVTCPLLKDSLMALRMRLIMGGGHAQVLSPWNEGVAWDDIHVYDLIYPIADSITGNINGSQTVKGNDWVELTDKNRMIASINPQNLDLGTVSWTMNRHDGPERVLNGYKLLRRSWTIRTSGNSPQPIRLRLYFTDEEAELLRARNICTACADTMSAYDFGIYQYTGPARTVNNFLHDNTRDEYELINADNFNLVPYDKGYYAEITATTNREFYIVIPERLPDPKVTLSVAPVNNTNAVLIKWNAIDQQDIAYYNVEVARGNSDFDAGVYNNIQRRDVSGTAYEFTDNDTKAGNTYYYRVRIVYKNGYTRYTATAAISFGEQALPVTIYPNPSQTGMFTILLPPSNGSSTALRLTNSLGQVLYERTVPYSGNVEKIILDISGARYPQAIYLLTIRTGPQVKTIKLAKLNQ